VDKAGKGGNKGSLGGPIVYVPGSSATCLLKTEVK